jgi:UDP-3-O-[3-hydroxymyristoyl] glucosamine N-acyltransferase
VGIAGHLVIANKTGIGAQAGISKSVEEEGEKIMGSPAYDVKDYFKSYAVFKKLPDLNLRLRELEEKIHSYKSNGHSL